MSKTDFKYCEISDIMDTCPDIGNYNSKRVARNWTLASNFTAPFLEGASKVVDVYFLNDTALVTGDIITIDESVVNDLTTGGGNGLKTSSGNINTQLCTLNGTIANTTTTIATNALTNAHTDLSALNAFVKVDDEWLFSHAHDATDGSGGDMSVGALDRGILGTDASAHTTSTSMYMVGVHYGYSNDEFSYFIDTSLGLAVLLVKRGAGSPTTQIWYPEDHIIEIGKDWTNYLNQMIVNVSMLVSASLDARFPRPIQKSFQHSDSVSGNTPEHDYVIKRITSCLTCSQIIANRNPDDQR